MPQDIANSGGIILYIPFDNSLVVVNSVGVTFFTVGTGVMQ